MIAEGWKQETTCTTSRARPAEGVMLGMVGFMLTYLCRLSERRWEWPTTKEVLWLKTSPRAQPSDEGQLHRSAIVRWHLWVLGFNQDRKLMHSQPAVLSSLLFQKAVQHLHISFFQHSSSSSVQHHLWSLWFSPRCVRSAYWVAWLAFTFAILFNIGKN